MGLFGFRSREQRFWDWFAQNSSRVRNLEADQDAVLDDLAEALAQANRNFVFEIGPDESPRTLVISADGIAKHFSAVEKFVALAPEIPDWLVVAFRQPGDANAEISFAGHTLTSADIWYTCRQGGGKTDITLFVRGIDEDNFEQMAGAVFLLLDNLLGEYVVGTRVGDIEWDTLPDNAEAEGLSPFQELRQVFGVLGPE